MRNVIAAALKEASTQVSEPFSIAPRHAATGSGSIEVPERRKQSLVIGPPDRRKRAVSTEQANEREKKRVSKELYDDLAQRLSVLKLDLDWLEHSHMDNRHAMPARLAQMQALLDHIISQTKSIASSLRPPLLDDFGLILALDWIAATFRKRTNVACRIESAGIPVRNGDPIDSAIFRLVQESLLNVERHANARNVRISLQRKQSMLSVRIEDDGIGMASNHENKPGCFGLIAMQGRIDSLGGKMRITNVAPRGMAIHATIPVDPHTPSLPQ